MSRTSDDQRRARREAARMAGWKAALATTVTAPFTHAIRIRHTGVEVAAAGWAVVDDSGVITVNRDRDGNPQQWAWVFAHLLLHLGLDHTDPDRLNSFAAVRGDQVDPVYGAACCVAVNRMIQIIRIGQPPFFMPELPGGDEASLVQRWRQDGVPDALRGCGTNGDHACITAAPDRTYRLWSASQAPWSERFARGLTEAAADAMTEAAAARGQAITRRRQGPWDQAKSWFMSSYPLLAAVAAGFTLVPDAEIARAWDISIAAVSAEHGEIYINPLASLSADEWRFVLAHEMLHAALGHDRRAHGRDVYLWNVACDYVINGWLTAMGVGRIPASALYDPKLTGLSAESVYDTLTTDLRRVRRLQTLGRAAGDVLGDWLTEPDAAQRRSSRRQYRAAPWELSDRARQVDLDEFYRRALTQGLEYHTSTRGTLPSGLEEEIRALEHPPLPWDAQLARWFDEHVRAADPLRTYARASRRQAATPHIPRPGRVRPEQLTARPTFGVVLDTSGSMPNQLLGKALGAIASYAIARDVPAARVVFCDAVAYDAGYLPVEAIADRVRVRGRGGTVLQPGIDLLHAAADFPADGPVLIVTDGDCDVLRVRRREHAYLIPKSAKLPFRPHGPVFFVE